MRVFVTGATGFVGSAVVDEWEAMSDQNVPRHGLAAAAIEGRIYAIGGATETGAGDVAAHEALTVGP